MGSGSGDGQTLRDHGSNRDTDVFCDRASPWQRGTNENTNGLLRQYFPKSTDLSKYSQEDHEVVERELNERPRMTLGDRTPAEVFTRLLQSHQQP